MIEFEFSLSLIDDEISPFELGDISIKYNNCLITSCDKSPSQSMMLFISLSELLDLIRRFVNSATLKEAKFIGVDSSFMITFTRDGNHLIINGTDCVFKVDTKEFVKVLYTSVKEFYIRYSFVLEHRNKYLDLKNSLAVFD